MCTPHPQKALNNEKCHLCKMQEMSMPACECALCMYLCVYMWWCGWILKMCVQFCGYVSASGWVRVCRDRGVCKGVSVYDDGKAGLLSFNVVLVGHWAICKCTELTAQTQSNPRPPSHILNTNPPSIPPTACLCFLAALSVPWSGGTNTDMAQDVCGAPCLCYRCDDELWTVCTRLG